MSLNNKRKYMQLQVGARKQKMLLPFYGFMLNEHIQHIRKKMEACNKWLCADWINNWNDAGYGLLLDALEIGMIVCVGNHMTGCCNMANLRNRGKEGEI